MRKKKRNPWFSLRVQVTFEESSMVVLLKGKRQHRTIVTPVFRLPDGTEFTGRRVSAALREKIVRARKSQIVTIHEAVTAYELPRSSKRKIP